MSINYFHSFGMTENYYVYVEQPMYINILKILTKKLIGSAVDKAIEFYDNINVSHYENAHVIYCNFSRL